MPTGANKNRKLIFLWTNTNWGGAQLYLLTILRHAQGSWNPIVILPQNSKKDLLGFYDKYNVQYRFLKYSFDAKDEPTLFGKIRRQYERLRSEFETYFCLRKFDLS